MAIPLKLEDLESQLLMLPVELRIRMADVLLQSLNSSRNPEQEVELAEEMERRLQAVTDGEEPTIPGEDAIAKIRARFRSYEAPSAASGSTGQNRKNIEHIEIQADPEEEDMLPEYDLDFSNVGFAHNPAWIQIPSASLLWPAWLGLGCTYLLPMPGDTCSRGPARSAKS